jgi:serine/threonine-protein kinase
VDYLKGRYHWNRRTTEDTAKAVHFFEQAIQKDPNYASPYVGLADCYLILWGRAQMPAAEASRRATEAVRRALELDDKLGEAHTSLAEIDFFNYNWADADREFRRAVELSPSYATARHWYALYLSAAGKHDEAVTQIRKAQELEPLSLIINANVGWILYIAGRTDESIENSQRVLEMDASFDSARGYLAQAYLAKGKYAEAIAEFERMANGPGGSSGDLAELANAYAVAGQKAKALKILEDLKQRGKREHVPAYSFATVAIGLGDKNQALDWLEKSAADAEGSLVNLKVHPRFANLRGEARYQALLKKLGVER